MYNIDFKNIKKGYFIGFIFFIIGLITFIAFLTIPLVILNSKNKYDSSTNAVNLEYEIRKNEDGGLMYSPIYYFEVDGKEYTCETSSSSSSRTATKNDIIYYNKDNPTDCMTQYQLDMSKTMIYFSAIPFIFIVVGLLLIFNIRKKVKKAKYLAQNGTLIKNLPYTMVDSNTSINGVQLQSIAVNYTFPDGTIKQLIGNPRYDYKMGDADQLVDLLIDPTDPNNYYIDFNIEPKY